MRYITDDHKFLSKFASRDTVRTNINCIIFDHDLKRAVSTDGHRLYASKGLYDSTKPRAARLDLFEKELEIIEVKDVKPPVIKNILPSVRGYTGPFGFDVPQWFEKLEKYKKTVPLRLSFHNSKVFIGLNEWFDLKECLKVGIDAKLLAPLAGSCVNLYAQDAMSPVIITEGKNKIEVSNVLEAEWFALIMPLRI